MKTRRLIKGTSTGGILEQAYTPSNLPPYADTAETLTEPFTVGKDTTAATTGYVKFASVSLPAAYRSASARFEVLDKNPVNAQTQMCGVEVVARNVSETSVTVTAQLLYGSSAYLSKIYACVKKGSYPVIVDLYFDITSSNPQETLSCIKPLFTFTRVTRSTTFTFITDNEQVSALPTDTTNTRLSTVRVLVTEAADSEKLNGKAASDIFESDGVTAKKATSLIPDSNGAVNPLGRKDGGTVGAQSIALGKDTLADGQNSTALGHRASAGGNNSTALGSGATAGRDYSTALGYRASAGGNDSTALGYRASAGGNNSTALGPSAYVYGNNSTALGYLANVSESDSNVMQLGNDGLSVLRCHVNLTVTSDERDKTDINNITNALQFLEKLNPVTFVSNDRTNYISEEDKQSENYRKYGMCDYDRIAHAAGTKKGERRRCGLLAQEVIAAMQEVYGTDNYANIVNDNFHDLAVKPSDVENKYTLAYANLVPFLIGAIKELNAKIKELEGK